MNLQKHFDMNITTKRYMRLGTYVVAIWNGAQIGLNLCNSGRKIYSFH